MNKKDPVPKGWERKMPCEATMLLVSDTSTQDILPLPTRAVAICRYALAPPPVEGRNALIASP
jgi:hypothetical protein